MANLTANFRADPVNFLTNHVTLIGGPTDIGDHIIHNVNLSLIRDVGRFGDNRVRLTPDPDGGDFLTWQILPWQQDSTVTGVLGGVENYFYTGPLQGCSFAVDKNWYHPTVSHSNALSTAPHNKIQVMSNRLRGALFNCTSMWSKESMFNDFVNYFINVGPIFRPPPNIVLRHSYNPLNSNIWFSVFGLKGYMGWSFYLQAFRVDIETAQPVNLEKLNTWL